MGALRVWCPAPCLDHFIILEKKKIGETTNMLNIVTTMQLADKIINI
jgi:hypothetical protein